VSAAKAQSAVEALKSRWYEDLQVEVVGVDEVVVGCALEEALVY